MINRGNNTKRDFEKMAGDLIEEIHAASVLVDLEGESVGWAPIHAIPILAKALRDATKLMDWQPIETAPRNSQSIMVHCPELENTYLVSWIRYEPTFEGWMHFGSHGQWLRETPTHWMPIPASPAIDTAETPASKEEK